MSSTPLNYQHIKEHFILLLSEAPNFKQQSKTLQMEIVEKTIDEVLEKLGLYISESTKAELHEQLLNEVVWGLHSLQHLQDDPHIEEIMINTSSQVFIKKRFTDHLLLTDIHFTDEELNSIIERLLEGTGRRVDRSSPLLDVRIADGSRVNIVMPPLSPAGPMITIRKFPKETYLPEDLQRFGMFDEKVKSFLETVMKAKANVLISGGTATGKTTLLSACLNWLSGGDKGERVVIIEETAELHVPDHLLNTVRLETRPVNSQGSGEYTIRDLVKNALRMRPDRIIVGEARGGEAFDLLQAMNTGHQGSLTTIHANSPAMAIDRLQALVLIAGFQELPLQVIQKWIADSIDLIVQIKRDSKMNRVISEIATIDRTTGKVTELFTHTTKGYKTNNTAIAALLNRLKK
jgi:pilus assembly protein CpaF